MRPEPTVLSVVIGASGQVEFNCHIPKIEAVKLLLSVVEELRLQAYDEQRRVVQVAPAAQVASLGRSV